LQSYIRRLGNPEEEEAGRDGEAGDAVDDDFNQPPGYDEYTTEQPRKNNHSNNDRCEVEDLLGMEQNSRHDHVQNVEDEDLVVEATHKKHKKKKKKKRESTEKEEPSLINFDDDWSSAPSVPPKATPSAIDDVKSNRTKSSGKAGHKVTGGYGSVGNNSTDSKAASKDWSGDWDEDWTSGWSTTTSSAPPEEKKSEVGASGWEDDWGEGWNTVDLSAKTD